MLSAIVLAAGESRRMGKPKAVLVLRGLTFLETICQRLGTAGFGEIVVVLGSRADEVAKRVRLDRERIVVNEKFKLGQLSSLQRGIGEVSPGAEAALVALVDHPLVVASTYAGLRAEWEKNREKIVIATYRGRGGHPVIFPRSLFKELMNARAGEGARAVVRKDPRRVIYAEFDDPGIVADIDTPEGYKEHIQEDMRGDLDER